MAKGTAASVVGGGSVRRADADVKARLSRLIIELELEPGMLVSEASLIKLLACSRGQLREAVVDLHESGLVNVLPRAGIVITSVGVDDVRHVIESRVAIEGHCARMAAIRATPADIDRLRTLSDQLAEVATSDSGWGVAYVAMDRQVHEAVAAMARNPILERVLGRLLLANARIWNLFFARMEAGRFHVSHQDTVDAIANHDPDAAEAAVRHHLRYSTQFLGDALDPLLGADAALARGRR